MKTQKRTLIYGICYFLVFVMLSAAMPILRDGIPNRPEKQPDPTEGKNPESEQPEQPSDEPVVPAKPSEPLSWGYREVGGNCIYVCGVNTAKSTLIIPETIDGYVVTGIDDGAFSGNKTLVDVVLPDTVSYLGEKAFCDCTNLKTVVLSNGMPSISSCVFENCQNLVSVEIPESVKEIGANAFEGCTSLETVTLPKRLETLGAYAFAGCSSLRSLDIPDTVTELPDGLLSGCFALQELFLPKKLDTIGYNVLPPQNMVPGLTVYVPFPEKTFLKNVRKSDESGWFLEERSFKFESAR